MLNASPWPVLPCVEIQNIVYAKVGEVARLLVSNDPPPYE